MSAYIFVYVSLNISAFLPVYVSGYKSFYVFTNVSAYISSIHALAKSCIMSLSNYMNMIKGVNSLTWDLIIIYNHIKKCFYKLLLLTFQPNSILGK